jgi:hypothetical protein
VAERATLDMVKIVGLENRKKVRNVAKLLVNNVHKAFVQLFTYFMETMLPALFVPSVVRSTTNIPTPPPRLDYPLMPSYHYPPLPQSPHKKNRLRCKGEGAERTGRL